MENTLKKPMTGIIPPLVTPLLDNDKLDIDGLERLIERLIKGGVHGLFILGTTGEAQSISYRLRHEMIKETCRINAGRLPVLVCISDTSIVESIHLAHVGAECGASAVVSAPPYYFAPGQPELAEFYEDLIPQLPLPIFLYNMPSHTKVNFAPATIQRIARNPQVVGFLEDSEIRKLISKEIDIPRLSQVRDIFVFCCFTGFILRSEERRVGKECRIGCRSRWSPYH